MLSKSDTGAWLNSFNAVCVLDVGLQELVKLKEEKNHFGRNGQGGSKGGMGFLFRPQNAGRSLLGGEGIPRKSMAKETGSEVGMNKTYWRHSKPIWLSGRVKIRQ